uniref:Uncharacterized protein n=1 Tax=Rhizophora mucronata TaxID=61149 RepID=A0A2P2NWM3_RHIMU
MVKTNSTVTSNMGMVKDQTTPEGKTAISLLPKKTTERKKSFQMEQESITLMFIWWQAVCRLGIHLSPPLH